MLYYDASQLTIGNHHHPITQLLLFLGNHLVIAPINPVITAPLYPRADDQPMPNDPHPQIDNPPPKSVTPWPPRPLPIARKVETGGRVHKKSKKGEKTLRRKDTLEEAAGGDGQEEEVERDEYGEGGEGGGGEEEEAGADIRKSGGVLEEEAEEEGRNWEVQKGSYQVAAGEAAIPD